jgi:glycerophosphoryl diester phosphodiesterase
MGFDLVAHHALPRARQAGAPAVHLHPSQLTEEVVGHIRAGGVDVHAWDVNDLAALDLAAALGIRVVCTDHLEQAPRWRASKR